MNPLRRLTSFAGIVNTLKEPRTYQLTSTFKF